MITPKTKTPGDVGYAPTCDNINVCRAAWILNGYCIISGLVNWAQHSDSKTLVKKVKSNF